MHHGDGSLASKIQEPSPCFHRELYWNYTRNKVFRFNVNGSARSSLRAFVILMTAKDRF